MLLKRAVYNEVRGFDEDYFMYGEDIDLSYKLLKAGYHNYYLGSTSMIHYKGESTQRDTAYLDRFYGAMHIFYQKHFKSNFVLNTLVRTGVFFAKIFSSRKKASTVVSKAHVKETFLISEDENLLERLSEKLKITITVLPEIKLAEKDFINSTLIFDSDYLSFSKIIGTMEQLRNNSNSFRIKPPGCNFIIGSDFSDEKGEVDFF